MTTYHVIPHSHWDREWYLTFDHFRVRLVHMLDDLLAILEERPDFECFLLDGQTVVVEDYLAVRPERRNQIERFVAEGRLALGPWYVLPDTFLVSGEALIRNLMRGRAAARSFGASMDVGYIPDSFGHTAQIPQILRGFGVETAIVWRGFGGEPGQEPSEYRWRGPDGSEVLMEHLSDVGYSAAYFATTSLEEAPERFDEFRGRVDGRARTEERLVLSGGDHHWPDRDLPDVIARLDADGGDEYDVAFSTLARFAEALQRGARDRDVPHAEGELRFGYRWAFNVTGGVYSSRMPLKQANTAAQRRLERYLEPMDALAVRAGAPSQQALLAAGWDLLLQNHPHDSICGCSIDPVHREMATRFEKLDGLARGVEEFAWQALAPDSEGEAGDDQRLTFFNPSPFARDAVVTCDIAFFKQQVVVGLNPDVVHAPPRPPVDGFRLIDPHGTAVPFEVVGREERYGIVYSRFDYPQQSRDDVFTVRVPLAALPPLGLRTLRIERTSGFDAAGAPELSGDARSVENRFVRVEVGDDGAFRVHDKTTARSFGPLAYFEDGADAGDEYNYSPPPNDQILRSTDGAHVTVEAVPGRYQRGLRVTLTWSLPTQLTPDLSARTSETTPLAITTTAWLTPFSRHVTFETAVANTARDHRLRAVFETGRATNHHYADNAFAVLSREQHAYDPAEFEIEVPASVAPMHRFVTVEDDTAGATLLTDGLPEYELKHDSNGILALTLLRCVGELGRDDLFMRPGGQGGWRNETPEAQCLGEHRFRYAFLPHAAGWVEQLPLIHEASEAFALPIAQRAAKRSASHADASLLRIAPSTLVLSACKEVRDDDGLVLRVYNPSPKPVEGRIDLGAPLADVLRTNLEERDGVRVPADGSTIRDMWPPFRIHTYRLRFDDALPGGGEGVSR